MRISLLYTAIIRFLASSGCAITDSERAVLLHLHHELELSWLIIDEAAQAANRRD